MPSRPVTGARLIPERSARASDHVADLLGWAGDYFRFLEDRHQADRRGIVGQVLYCAITGTAEGRVEEEHQLQCCQQKSGRLDDLVAPPGGTKRLTARSPVIAAAAVEANSQPASEPWPAAGAFP